MTSTNELTLAKNERCATWDESGRTLLELLHPLFLDVPSVSQSFANNFKVEICHMPTLRPNVNTSNFTSLIFIISPAGYTCQAFIKLKNLGNTGYEN